MRLGLTAFAFASRTREVVRARRARDWQTPAMIASNNRPKTGVAVFRPAEDGLGVTGQVLPALSVRLAAAEILATAPVVAAVAIPVVVVAGVVASSRIVAARLVVDVAAAGPGRWHTLAGQMRRPDRP